MSLGGFGAHGLGSAWGNSLNSEPFPDPFADYASLAMPETIPHALRWCWTPGTLIELSDGSQVPIETVRPGMQVRTANGLHRSVKATGERQISEDIVEIEVAGLGSSLPLRLTGNHKLIAVRGKHKNTRPNKTKPWLGEVVKLRSDELCVGDYLLAPVNAEHGSTGVADYPGWLLGMYIAEACSFNNDAGVPSGLRFYLGRKDEDSGVVQQLLTTLDNTTRNEHHAYYPSARPDVITVTTSDAHIVSWMRGHGGVLARTKRLSSEVFTYTEEFKLALIAGWLDGDGHVSSKDGRVLRAAGTTASKELAYQLFRLAQSLNMTPSLHEIKNRGFKDRAKKKLIYDLVFSQHDCARLLNYSVKMRGLEVRGKNAKHGSSVIHGDRVYYRVKKVSKVPYTGPVYNIEVEEDHSYIANCCGSMNCEFIFLCNGLYREASRRLISYFITDLEFNGASDDIEERWRKFLEETLDIKKVLHVAGLDLSCYGNSFSSVIPSTNRFLWCPQCSSQGRGGAQYPFSKLAITPDFKFRWQNFQYHAYCPACNYDGAWRIVDRPAAESNGFRIKRWSPHDIEIQYDEWSDETRFIWKIPEEYRRQIREGRNLLALEQVPVQVIEAIKTNSNLLFEKDFIHHLKEDALAGVVSRGWGISRVLTNFRQAWYVQVLHRYNEAIALDYVIPFRLITPEPGDKATGADLLTGANAGAFMSMVHAMLRKRRRDPAGWHTLPFSVQYKAIGGDAKQMATDDMIIQGQETLLNMIGMPAEMYKASLTVQAAPTALRLFEASNATVPHSFNSLVSFVIRKVAMMLRWEPVDARLARVMHADDANRQMTRLQLATSGLASYSNAMKGIGMNFKEETKQMMDDQRVQAEASAELEEQMSQAAMMKQMNTQPQPGQPAGAPGDPGAQGAAGAPGAPGAPGGQPTSILAGLPQGPNQQVTPEEQNSRAQYLAQQLQTMPESQKDSELIRLKKLDPNLHAVVTAQLKDMRQQMRTQGAAMMQAQMFGKAGSLRKRATNMLRQLKKS